MRLSFFLFFTKKDDLIRHYHLIYKPDEITCQRCQYLCGCSLYRTWLGYPCIIRIIDCKCRIIILLYLSLHLSQRGSSGKLDTWLHACWVNCEQCWRMVETKVDWLISLSSSSFKNKMKKNLNKPCKKIYFPWSFFLFSPIFFLKLV